MVIYNEGGNTWQDWVKTRLLEPNWKDKSIKIADVTIADLPQKSNSAGGWGMSLTCVMYLIRIVAVCVRGCVLFDAYRRLKNSVIIYYDMTGRHLSRSRPFSFVHV
jgi:hypothetical protein